MYMKLKKKLEHTNRVWDRALARQRSRTESQNCLCGKRLNECDDAYAHTTQGF